MNKNKGFIGIGLILAIILGIVVVGGGAYYLGKSGSKQEVKSPENILPDNNIIIDQKQSQNIPVFNNDSTSTTTSITDSLTKPIKQVICSLSDNNKVYQNGVTFFAQDKNCATLSGFVQGWGSDNTKESVTFNDITKTWKMVSLSFYQANFSPDGKHFAYTASNIPVTYHPLGTDWDPQQFIVSDNIAGPIYHDVYYPQYSKDGKHLGYCATKTLNGQYLKVIDGVETVITKDDYLNTCDSLFGYNPNPTINRNLHKDITSPNGKYILSESTPHSEGVNCNMASCLIYKTFKNISTGETTTYGPYDMVDDNIFSSDSKHFAYIASLYDDSQKPQQYYYAVVIDGKVKDHYDEVFNMNFSDDGKSVLYNARLGSTVYYIVESL